MSKILEVEVGGADEFIATKAQPQKREPLVFRILSSKRYSSFLKVAQYLSCAFLALALFVDEFFQSSAFLAEQIIYYIGVATPAVVFYTPLYVGFFTTLPSPVRTNVWSRFKKDILLEGIILVLIVALIPVAIFNTIQYQKEEILDVDVSIAGSTLSVMFLFFSITSFSHYKKEILCSTTVGRDGTHENVLQWAQSIQEHEEKNKMQGACKIFLRLMAQFPISSAVAWISTILYTACLPIQGLTIGYITQTLAEATSQSSFWDLFEPGLYFLLTSVGMAVFLWTTKIGFAAFGTSVEDYFRLQMTKSVCSVGPGKKTTAALLDSGDLSSRYSRDLAMISNFIDKNKLFTSSGFLVSSIVVLFTVDWRMGFFFVVTCPALIIMLAEKPGKAHKAGTVAAARLQGRFENCVELRRTMDLYSAGGYVYTKSVASMKDDMQAIGNSKWAAAHFVSVVHATGLAYTSLISFAFILFSIPLAKTSPTEAVNHLSAALVILSQLKSPFSQIGQGVEHWLSIAPALFRLNQFSIEPKDDDGNDEASHHSTQRSESDNSDYASDSSLEMKNSLELRDVHFRYNGNTPNVLCGVNAKLETGQYTCIVGGSGAGKSTLLNILTRELIETEGSILLDGRGLAGDFDGISISKYREQIAIVFQSGTFFHGTIAENIRLGMPNASDEDVAIAADRAQCDFLKDLPDGLDTELGGSVNLSGGQGQRVCLARALCRNPRFLILDEATSALDPHTEEEAVKMFTDLAHNENVAVVSVTHRLDTTKTCDKVVVLKDGIVAEEGSPVDLYKRKGLFYNMGRTKNYSSNRIK